MVAQVGYSVVRRSRGRVALCAVCTVDVETWSAGLLVEAQNQGLRFVSGLASKPQGQFSLVWPQNRWWPFSLFWPQNRWLGFSSLDLKIGSYGLVFWASNSPRQFLGLSLRIKQASVCRLRHKTDEGRTARNMRRDLTACFAWKQVTLRFLSLTLKLTEARWRVVHVVPL
jgi:hypothetical protein